MSSAPTVTYRMIEELGWGSFAVVVKAVDESTGAVIAYKKGRSSLRTQRPFLRHEARVLQRLQGHPAIPKIFGYQHVTHYEHITMELLGPSLGDLLESEHAMPSTTVLRVGEQLISALKHLFAHGIVHRDIKPCNVLVSAVNPAQVCLIDYGLALPLSPAAMASAPTNRYKPDEEKELIVGTVDWCSVNAHDGVWSRPRDDVESLGYMLFYLYFGRIPWRVDYRGEAQSSKMRRVRGAKAELLAALPLSDVPSPLNDLLRVAQNSVGDEDLSDPLQRIQDDIRRVVTSTGQIPDDAPLDWTPAPIPSFAPPLMHFVRVPYDSTEGDKEYAEYIRLRAAGIIPTPDPTELLKSRTWMELEVCKVSDRDSSLTFPEDEATLLDGMIPDAGLIKDE